MPNYGGYTHKYPYWQLVGVWVDILGSGQLLGSIALICTSYMS